MNFNKKRGVILGPGLHMELSKQTVILDSEGREPGHTGQAELQEQAASEGPCLEFGFLQRGDV